MSDLEKVKQLRKSTGAGFKDCNAALKESNGDLDKAVEILRVKGIAKASKKMSRNATEGVIAISGNEIGEKITIGRSKTFHDDNSQNFVYQHSVIKDNVSKLVVMVSLKANQNSDKFKLFGKQLSMHIAASNPIALNSIEIDKVLIDKEISLITEELKSLGKPEEIAKKISLGKINKFKEENSLMTQDWVMEPKKKVKDILNEIKIPNLKIKEFKRIKIGE